MNANCRAWPAEAMYDPGRHPCEVLRGSQLALTGDDPEILRQKRAGQSCSPDSLLTGRVSVNLLFQPIFVLELYIVKHRGKT